MSFLHLISILIPPGPGIIHAPLFKFSPGLHLPAFIPAIIISIDHLRPVIGSGKSTFQVFVTVRVPILPGSPPDAYAFIIPAACTSELKFPRNECTARLLLSTGIKEHPTPEWETIP